jgi:ABC-2 type transport system ATP-binding protein
MSAISVRDLTKRYGAVAAVDSLSFDVAPGTVTAFLGPNGAGKTTTLRMLLGLAKPTSGTVTVGGTPYRRLEDPAQHVGAVLETTGFHPVRRARDHLRVVAVAAGVPEGRVDEVLAQVGLTAVARQRVKGFSLGMRQRLGLATALLGHPRVLILDEPANGLDPEGVRWLRRTLRAFADDGGTVLMSSHLLAEVAQTVDDVVIIASGRLVRQAKLSELAPDGRELEDLFLSLTEPHEPPDSRGASEAPHHARPAVDGCRSPTLRARIGRSDHQERLHSRRCATRQRRRGPIRDGGRELRVAPRPPARDHWDGG